MPSPYYASLSLPWSPPLAYAPKPNRQSCLGFPAVWVRSHSSDQILIGQPLASRAVDEAFQAAQRMPLHVAFIQAERELVNVAMQVLVAGVVIDAMQAALENCQNAFDAVRRHAVASIFSSAVNDG